MKRYGVLVGLLVLVLVIIQPIALGDSVGSGDLAIQFTPNDVALLPGTHTLYLANYSDKSIMSIDMLTGQSQTLALPNSPTRIVATGARIYVALSVPGNDAVAFIDPSTFTLTETILLDIDISGFAIDSNNIYAYNSAEVEAFNFSGEKQSTLYINLYDLKLNPADGLLYGTATSGTVCIGAPAGQLSLLKRITSYSGYYLTLLPDGKTLLVSNGALLTCSADPEKALVFIQNLPQNSAVCFDTDANEMYLLNERLIQVYDTSTFALKRVLPQTKATSYLLFTPGSLTVAQKNSANNLEFHTVDPGALLSSLKINGDAISELYPLQFTVDGGTVPNASATITLSATSAVAGSQITGDVGAVPLAVGKNTLSVSVKNTASGVVQTYSVTITRAAQDPQATSGSAFENLGFIPNDFTLDPDHQAAYFTEVGGNSLYKVDLKTGAITVKQFALPAERLTYANGNIFVSLLRSGHNYNDGTNLNGYGAVAVVDADAFTTTAIFNTNIDPYDIVADDQGYVYLSSGSNQWSIVASYDSTTGELLSTVGSIYYNSMLAQNPVSGKLYSITNSSAPTNIEAYVINDGKITKVYENIKNRDYNIRSNFTISPDGNYIFSGSGSIFTSAPTQTDDIVYDGTLGSTFTSICFNLADGEVYAANSKTLTVYDYTTRAVKNTYTMTDEIINMSFDDGHFTLIQKDGNQKYYVRKLAVSDHAADLTTLGESSGMLSPAFSSSCLSYSLVLPSGTSSVTISPVTDDIGASLAIDGKAVLSKTITLEQGATASVSVVVQSADKMVLQTYSVYVYRQTQDRSMLINPAFLSPTQEISAGGALFLTAKDKPYLFKFDGTTGAFSALPLPGLPTALGCAGDTVVVAMEDTRTNTYSIGTFDPVAFTMCDVFSVDTRFTGIRCDDDRIYAFTDSVVSGYSRSDHSLDFTKADLFIGDVQPDPINGMVYITGFSSISSYRVKNGQLTLIKTNGNYSGQKITIMPDGLHLVLPTGIVLRCSSTPEDDLVPESVTLPNLDGYSVDAQTNSLYAIDKYLNGLPTTSSSYLISIFDASDMTFRRTLSDPTPMQFIFGSSDVLYLSHADSQGNLVLRESYADAMLQAVKIGGDVKDGFYPLRSGVDAGEVSSSTTSTKIEASAAEQGDVITGNTGVQPLATGKNVFSITVTNPASGHTQTYTITLTRRPSDPAATDGRVTLGFTPLDVALDPDRQVEYMTASNDKNLYRVDLQTGVITKKAFSVPVERLTVKNGKLYATLLRTGHQFSANDDGFGAVAVIDTASFTTNAIVSTNIDPYDIEADDAGNIYLAPGSGQDSTLADYNTTTGKPLPVIKRIDSMSFIDRNPMSSKIYMVTTNLSPRDIYAFETAQGILTKVYNSPYLGDYEVSTYERISPDGTRIFNGAGTMFACKDTQTGDMAYLGTLGRTFTAICFDFPNNRFYTAQEKALTMYSYSGGTISTLNTLNFADSFVDLQYDGTEIVAVQKNSDGQYYTRKIVPDMLSSGITVAGNQVPGFNPLVHEYSITLPTTTASVDIAATAFDTAATISGDTGSQTLKVGDNIFTITISGSVSGLSGTYTLHITNPSATASFIVSPTYYIDKTNKLMKISVNTSVSQLKSNISNDASNIKIYDKDGKEYSGNTIATGMVVKLIVNGSIADELTISVLGDVSGDGIIDITDILYIRASILNTYSMKPYQMLAADIKKDDQVDITDILYIRAHITGTYTIRAN